MITACKILIVGQRYNELNDKLSVASDYRTAGPPVGVLPANSVVLWEGF